MAVISLVSLGYAPVALTNVLNAMIGLNAVTQTRFVNRELVYILNCKMARLAGPILNVSTMTAVSHLKLRRLRIPPLTRMLWEYAMAVRSMAQSALI